MNVPCYFRSMPIGRKFTLLLLAPSITVMVLVVAGLLAFQLRMFRQGFARELSAVADIVGANSVAAVAFNDPKAASEILDTLRATPHVTGAVLTLPDSTVFARYGTLTIEPSVSAEKQYIRQGADAVMIQPVLLDGRQVATLKLKSDYYSAHQALMRVTATMLVIMLVVSLGIAVVLSNWLQQLVSRPILRLTQTARWVAANNDYTVRAAEESCGDLGILTRAFNQMLMRIQDQETALVASQKKFEAILNSIEGVIWEADARTWSVTFVSRRLESIFGYRVEDWLNDPQFWLKSVFASDRTRVTETSRRLAEVGKPFQLEYRVRAKDGRLVHVRESITVEMEDGHAKRLRGLIVDVSEQKAASEQVDRLNRRLVDVSRLAGMAEVATGVLHNVGNVLNSVSVSVNLMGDRLKNTRMPNLRRATTMLMERNGTLAQFLTEDRQGKVLPEYLARLAEYLEAEQAEMRSEVRQLSQNVEHIKEIVARQQNYAKVSGVFEHIDATELVEDTLRINGSAFERHRIEIVREYEPDLPRVVVDRHKALQILVNLARNAKHALDAARSEGKVMTFRVKRVGERVIAIKVRDNGIGIPASDLVRVFQHGFTTKKDGHGFGLHSGANAAREMGGRLSGFSSGPGLGAEFTLELPVAPAVPAAAPAAAVVDTANEAKRLVTEAT